MTSHADKSSVRLFRSDTRESHLRGDEYRASVSESGRNRSRLSPRNTSMTRHAPPECPSEVTWASKRSSRVTWKQAMNRRPPQDWSNSRPDTFHRDDRVPFKLSEVDESRKLDVCRLDECLSEPQSARGGVRDSAAPLTRWHLDKHVQRSGMASFHTEEFLHDHDTVEDWELMLVSEGKRSLLEQFNASKLQHSPEGGEEESSSVCPTKTKTARDTLQSARNTPHAVAPLRRHAAQRDHAAEEEEEEEIIARFYADQHARRREPQPHMGTDSTPSPSVPDVRYTQPNRQYDDNPHVGNQLTMASSSTIPQNIHDSHVKKEHARPTEDEPERINWEHEGESTEKKKEPKLSTLEEFRQYVIQQKLQSRSKTHTRNAGENATLTHSPALTKNTEKRKQNENLNDISQSMDNTHMPLLKSNTLHNNNLISSTKLTLDINTTETKNPQDKSFANARQQDRDVVSHAEEAERSAVLAAAHRGATVIAGAEVLSRREQQDRDVVSHAEEAERSAVLAAAHRGATVIAGAEVLSRREQQDRDVVSHAEEAERSAVLAAAHRGATVIAGAEVLSRREQQDRDVVSHAEEAERSAVLAAAHRGATVIAGAEVLSRREQQDRDVVSHAEEAERSAVLAAAHRGATAIAGAEVLSRREQQDRDVVSHAEEAERSAVLAAAHRGATVIAGAEVLSRREQQDRDVVSHAEEAERSAVLAAAHRGATVTAGAEVLSRREQQDRDVVSHAEEAERSAVLAAAHRGATVIAGAEVLSRREQQDRDVVSHAEEAERSAVLAAAQSVRFVWGACGFYGGENVLGLREKRDSIASWPLRVGALDPKSVNSVEELAAVSHSGMSLDTGLGVSDEGNACATAVSRVNDAKLDGILLTGGCELTQLNVRGGVLLAEETVSSLRVEAKETEVQSDMLGKVAVHPALRTGEVRATTIPHGEPLGDDSDDDIPIHPRYTFFGCLLSPFVCCMSRRQTQISRIEDPLSNE
ncbi:hypothetical protein, conserved [Trypanosoma cruzi]|uniref:Uncharacterized protein n=1 Tax=Trypanosoma cruzi (strain CL Brener) TaxID=353153 RepID=Q4DS37_TRYCC|nr:hypothetical protein, conserved [Trypanosoma cruzi]EAN95347.1 hypothetical protein, conserved [Trypanosoma cruzi]|eukprot:XP_817198.1 hypothetical protein [Trypanosoma cruzi strain CL Brener]